VLDAAAEELLENGLERFAMTSVANRAGVHHTTIYRRWQTKSRLVLDALIEHSRANVRPPKSGSLRTDLSEYFSTAATVLAEPRTAALIRGLVAIRPDDLASEHRAYWADRMQLVNQIFDDAAARGETVAAEDRLRVAELISAPIWMRLLVTGQPIDGAYVEELVDCALRAIDFNDGTRADGIDQRQQLERDNETLKRIVADKELEVAALKELARANPQVD
jgi:AcrR family transcriptional regulator